MAAAERHGREDLGIQCLDDRHVRESARGTSPCPLALAFPCGRQARFECFPSRWSRGSFLARPRGRCASCEVGAREVGAREVGVREVGAREVGARDVGAREVGVREVGIREVGAREVGVREVGAREVGAREVGAREVGAREVGAREVGARFLPAASTQSFRDLYSPSNSTASVKRFLIWIFMRLPLLSMCSADQWTAASRPHCGV